MLAAAVLAIALAQGGPYCWRNGSGIVVCGQNINRGSSHPYARSPRAWGRSDLGSPILELAPLSGAGMGAACACQNITGSKGEVVTFSRASVGECYSTDAQTITQCASNIPRVMSGNTAVSQLGLLFETAKQNDLLWSRDWSNAAWVKTSMTCTRTATGMRNDANGASLCTATAGLGTVLQATTTDATTRNFTFHIKRVTGTGTVEATVDGATWVDITASLTSSWKRVVGRETLGCTGGNCIVVAGLSNSVASKNTGIRITTSGDAVAVDFAQLETGVVVSTPIETTTAVATRAVDAATVAVPALASMASVGCARAVLQRGSATGDTGSVDGDAVTGRYLLFNTTASATDGTNTATIAGTGGFGAVVSYRSEWGTGALTVYNETAVTSNAAAFTGTMGTTGPVSLTAGNYVLKSLTLDRKLGSGCR